MDLPDATIRNRVDDVTPRSRPRLRWTERGVPKEVTIEEVAVIGSAPGAGIVLDDRSVSRLHAELEPQIDGLWIRDLGSLNGSYVNGIRVVQASVPEGGTIRVGTTDIKVTYGEPALPPHLWEGSSFGPLLGASPPMRELFGVLAQVAPTASSVLVQGETGTGKELVARAIHEASPRAGEPFIVVDCAALPEPLLESELFGHARGAFTGAIAARQGAFEAANGGTLFLDEVGELPLSMQPKLLRVLESRTVRRVGETQHRTVDVRIVSATHRDLRQMVNLEAFREDLYFRLAVLPVRVPPLRERSVDVPLLLERFLGRSALTTFGAERLDALVRAPWLGNVRELRNFVERVLAFGPDRAMALGGSPTSAAAPDEPVARPAPSSPELDASPSEASLLSELKDFREAWVHRGEAIYLKHLLERHQNNVAAAARAAGVNRTHLYKLIKKHGV
jgi:two-component system, NtrC family, response regulator GlrR